MSEQTAQMRIDPQEVMEAFLDCLYKESELEFVEGAPEGTVVVEGVIATYGLHPIRLEEKRERVTGWLNALPKPFHKGVGGGWSFLNACNQEDGFQWTGLQERVEQLFCLGIGLGLVKCLLPRDVWASLPGGVPYYEINIRV